MNNNIKLHKGDCLEVMQELILQGVKVDMILADPPYGTTACRWDNVIPFEPMWDAVNGLVKDNGAIALFGSEPFSSMLRCSNLKMYKYDWYWNKTKPNGFQHSKNRPMTKVETISVFSKAPMGHLSLLGDKRMQYNPQGVYSIGNKIVKNCTHSGNTMGGENHKSGRPNQVGKEYEAYTNFPHNVLDYANLVGKNTVHPTQKPVALLEYLIKTYTSEGDTILDFTMGSGSTGVACVNTNRKFIGIELDKNYFTISIKRINEAVKISRNNL